jgi:protein O-mannosyl-transferase
VRSAERLGLLAAGSIVAAVAVAYANALGAAFQFDDWNVIVHDPRVQSLAAWWSSMPGIRPLLKLSYAANHASPFGVVGFHAVNVGVHAANALLVLWLLARLAWREGLAARQATLAAWVGALVFALHPVQTEAVTYVSGRSASLAALLALGSVLASIEGRERGRSLLAFGVSPVLFACAVGVKETAVVTPAAILLWWATDPRRPLCARDALRAVSGHALVLLAAALALAASPTYRHLLSTSLALRDPLSNLVAQAHGVTYLLGQLVRLDRLNVDPLLDASTAWFEVAWLAGGLAVGIAALRSRPAVAFGILWLALWLAPTNSIIARLDLANDRQLYLALVGPAWLAGWWVARQARRRLVLWAAVVGIVLLGGATAYRNRVYADEITFWEDAVRKSPTNPRALNNLGYAYALAGRTEEAEAALVIAFDLAPRDVKIAVNLKLLRQGDLIESRPSP